MKRSVYLALFSILIVTTIMAICVLVAYFVYPDVVTKCSDITITAQHLKHDHDINMVHTTKQKRYPRAHL